MLLATSTASAQDLQADGQPAKTRLWTLQACIDYALENNISLQKSKLQKQSATEDLKGAKGALLPTVNASTNQSLGYQPWKDSGISTVTNGTVNTKVDKTSYNGSYSLSGQWTVWNGNRNHNTVKLDKMLEQEADLTVRETANTIQERIAQLYAQILYLAESVKVNEQMLETSRKNEERGQEMFNVGKMSKADLAQLSAERAEDEYAIVQAKGQLAETKLDLKQLLEITDEEDFDVAIPDVSDSEILAEIPSLQSVYEEAAIERTGVSVSIAKAGWMPTVNLTGGVTTSSNSLSSNGWGTQVKTNLNSSLGLGVTVPIYDGRATKTAVNKAKINQQQARLSLQDRQKTLYADIQDYWVTALSVESAQLSYDLLSEQFRLGLKNIVELMTGKDKLASAQQNQLQSKYLALYNQQMLKFYQSGQI